MSCLLYNETILSRSVNPTLYLHYRDFNISTSLNFFFSMSVLKTAWKTPRSCRIVVTQAERFSKPNRRELRSSMVYLANSEIIHSYFLLAGILIQSYLSGFRMSSSLAVRPQIRKPYRKTVENSSVTTAKGNPACNFSTFPRGTICASMTFDWRKRICYSRLSPT